MLKMTKELENILNQENVIELIKLKDKPKYWAELEEIGSRPYLGINMENISIAVNSYYPVYENKEIKYYWGIKIK